MKSVKRRVAQRISFAMFQRDLINDSAVSSRSDRYPFYPESGLLTHVTRLLGRNVLGDAPRTHTRARLLFHAWRYFRFRVCVCACESMYMRGRNQVSGSISADTGRERRGSGDSLLPIDFDFSVRKSADGRIHCEGWRVPGVSTVYRTRQAVSLSPSLRSPVCAPLSARTAVARSRAHAHWHAGPRVVRIRISVYVIRVRAVAPPRRADRYSFPHRSRRVSRHRARTCTRDVASDRCMGPPRRRREATYVIPVARFSNGGIGDIWSAETQDSVTAM